MKKRRNHVLMFLAFYLIRACHVSVAASGVFVYVDFFNFLFNDIGPERSGEAKTHVQNYCPKKVGLPTLCGPQNCQTLALVIRFWFKLLMEIAYLAIRWQSWQTFLKVKKLANVPPSNRGSSDQTHKQAGGTRFHFNLAENAFPYPTKHLLVWWCKNLM